jgi:hypothetical protein
MRCLAGAFGSFEGDEHEASIQGNMVTRRQGKFRGYCKDKFVFHTFNTHFLNSLVIIGY